MQLVKSLAEFRSKVHFVTGFTVDFIVLLYHLDGREFFSERLLADENACSGFACLKRKRLDL